jgi:drug/metabolite transporter (DMT)-like permease
MVAHSVEAPVMLMKKLGGMVSLIIGCLLTALGIEFQSTSSTVVGVLFLVLGAALLALKIIRRNQGTAQGS